MVSRFAGRKAANLGVAYSSAYGVEPREQARGAESGSKLPHSKAGCAGTGRADLSGAGLEMRADSPQICGAVGE
jgi:hypothetical protein